MRPSVAELLGLPILMGIIMATVALSLSRTLGPDAWLPQALFVGAIAPLALPLLQVVAHVRNLLMLRRSAAKGPAEVLPFMLRATPAGLEIAYGAGRATVDWSQLRWVSVRRGHIVAWSTSGALFLPIPLDEHSVAFVERLRWFAGSPRPQPAPPSSPVSSRAAALVVALIVALTLTFVVARHFLGSTGPLQMCPEGERTLVSPASEPNEPPVVSCVDG